MASVLDLVPRSPDGGDRVFPVLTMHDRQIARARARTIPDVTIVSHGGTTGLGGSAAPILSAVRICIASGTFPPDVGGPPTYLAQLIPALAARGHGVHVVTFGESQLTDLPCSIERVSRRAPIPLRLARFTKAVFRGTRDGDLLFVSDYGFPPAMINTVRRQPMVIKVVGDFAWEYSVRHNLVPKGVGIDEFQAIGGLPLVQLLKGLQRAYVSAADRVIVPSNYLRSIVSGWGVPSSKTRVVRNAVPSPPEVARLSPHQPVVLTVARLAPWKGIDTLIEAIAQIQDPSIAPQLVIVGDGDDRSRLERLASHYAPGRVTFLGQVDRAEVESLMAQSSTLALASGYEGLSHVLLEGMACGLPIIASDIEGNRELIAHGENGWLVPPGDVDGFASAIRQCVSSPSMAAEYGRRNRAWSQAHTVEHQVDRTLEVCLDAMASRAQ
jgi:glycosyltransferase involved in cell wall biosynthesis